jgi:hypothetical protein
MRKILTKKISESMCLYPTLWPQSRRFPPREALIKNINPVKRREMWNIETAIRALEKESLTQPLKAHRRKLI